MSEYVCEMCGRELEPRSGSRGRLRKFCPACIRERHRERVRARNRKKSLHAMGWRSRWALWAVEQRRADSALRHCGGATDPATFVWPVVRNGQVTVSEIRGQMNFAPGQLLGRIK